MQGYLYPLYHQNYWMGLVSNSSAYPRFSWIDITIRPPGVAGSYKHWGKAQGTTLAVAYASSATLLELSAWLHAAAISNSIVWLYLHSKAGKHAQCIAILPPPSPTCMPTAAAGLYLPDKQFEPYALNPPELCGVANYTQVYGAPPAWGWADINCGQSFISMCRIQSGCLQAARLCLRGLLRPLSRCRIVH